MIEDKYIETLDASDKRWFDYMIKWKGSEVAALYCLLHYLDCSRIYPDGSRPVQTINYGYRRDISGYIYIYNKLLEKCPNCEIDYYAKLIALHEENLNFEKDNPPIYYSRKSRTGGKSTERTTRAKDMFSDNTLDVTTGSAKTVRPKENASTRKAKALKDKSISFAFNNFKINK